MAYRTIYILFNNIAYYLPHGTAIKVDHHPFGRIEGERLRILNTYHVLPEFWTDEGSPCISCIYVHPNPFRFTYQNSHCFIFYLF